MMTQMTIKIVTCALFLLSTTAAIAEQILFTPPQGWKMAAKESLPPSVKEMIVGKGENEFPPSLNLGIEPFHGTQKEYLKIVKAVNDRKGIEWRDLGVIKTLAGEASLSQIDTQTEWGTIRMMHVILVRDGNAYIVTAASRADEFSKFSPEFFKSMQSLRFQ